MERENALKNVAANTPQTHLLCAALLGIGSKENGSGADRQRGKQLGWAPRSCGTAQRAQHDDRALERAARAD